MQEGRPSAEVTGLSGPLSETPWSADFVMQSIEVLPVLKRDGGIWFFAPEHADSLVLGWPAGQKPEFIAARAMEQLGLRPFVLHSTSWRHAGPEVILTYICVVHAPATYACDLPLSELPVGGHMESPEIRADLSERNDAGEYTEQRSPRTGGC